jgi:hypothetical protein
MKALSLRQPWLWAVLELGKTIENRRWNTKYRGPILLHAAKGCTAKECDDALEWMRARGLLGPHEWSGLEHIERGGICGYAEIVDVLPPLTANYLPLASDLEVDARWHMPAQYGFVLRNVRRLPFVPYPGSLGLFNVAPEVAAKAMEAA